MTKESCLPHGDQEAQGKEGATKLRPEQDQNPSEQILNPVAAGVATRTATVRCALQRVWRGVVLTLWPYMLQSTCLL